MGTVTTTRIQTVFGDRNIAFGTITMSASYAAGGDDQDFEPVLRAAQVIISPKGGYVCDYIKATGKYQVRFAGTAGAIFDEPGAVDLSGIAFPFIAIGGE